MNQEDTAAKSLYARVEMSFYMTHFLWQPYLILPVAHNLNRDLVHAKSKIHPQL